MDVTAEEILRGGSEFDRREGRDSMYRVATFLLGEWWSDFPKMSDALTVLLLTWNWAFYRYGLFDQSALDTCLEKHWPAVEEFHEREIGSLTDDDAPAIRVLFDAMLNALRIASGKSAGKRSPVATAKALHLLAPKFFPIWDQRIARAYRCPYYSAPAAAYQRFSMITRDIAVRVGPLLPASPKSLLKQIDEYNYAHFTQSWI